MRALGLVAPLAAVSFPGAHSIEQDRNRQRYSAGLGATLDAVPVRSRRDPGMGPAPIQLAGYVVGRSSCGRRGLIIATAAGVHPGFTGCLTLELSNVGEIPIAIKPGIPTCQLFLHSTGGQTDLVDESLFVGLRRPSLGKIKLDDVAKKLAKRQPL